MIEKVKELKFHFWNNSSLSNENIERFVQKILKMFLEAAGRRKYGEYYGTLGIRLQDNLEDQEVPPVYFQEFVSGNEPAACFIQDSSVDKMTVRFDLYSVIGRQGTDLPFYQMGQIEFLVKYFNGEKIDPRVSQVTYERIWEKIEPFLKEDDCFLDVRWENKPSEAGLPADII